MLTSLTYISRSNLPPEAAEIQDLWAQALEKNRALDVTGALYFDGRAFLHFLEGEEKVIRTLFASAIEADSRHRDVRIVAEADLASRLFSPWPMKLIDGSRSAQLQRSFDYDDIAGMSVADASKLPFRLRRL